MSNRLWLKQNLIKKASSQGKRLPAFVFSSRSRPESGQTLIETITAIFVLTTALTAGLGMALYALNASASNKNQVIATNLAREGVEIARMMRDSNWLSSGAAGPPSSCADIGNQPCFPDAYSRSPYNFALTDNAALGNNNYRFRFDPANRQWRMDVRNGTENYFLCFQSGSGTYRHNDNGAGGVTCSTSNFARRVRVSTREGTSFNFSTSDPDNQEVTIQSIVQWSGKGCPAIDGNNISNTPAACKIIIEERMTNWKDYR